MNKSVTISWDEIVFEHRNKEYGAYPLRYKYPKILSISAVIVICVFLATMIGRQILQEETAQRERTVKVIKYTELEQPPPIERVQVEVPKAVAKYVAPKVTVEEVKKEDELMTMDQVRGMLETKSEPLPTGNETPSEVEKVVVVEPPPEPVVEKALEPPPEPVIIRKDPEFPGGKEALTKWLGHHLTYPPMAVRMGIEGSVEVQFSVDLKGKISDVTVVKSLHRLCDQEAIRLVNSMPDWIPGETNGVPTPLKFTLPIRFILQ